MRAEELLAVGRPALLAQGGPLQAIVIACGGDKRTVARWAA